MSISIVEASHDKIQKSEKQFLLDNLEDEEIKLCKQLIPQYKLPKTLKKLPYVPPSLQPASIDDYLSFDLNTW
jgi:hypothetical protein